MRRAHTFETSATSMRCQYMADGREARSDYLTPAVKDYSGSRPRKFEARYIQAGFWTTNEPGTLSFPSCAFCNACIPVRILADRYEFSRSERRILSRNTDLSVLIAPNSEYRTVFKAFMNNRHPGDVLAGLSEWSYKKRYEDNTHRLEIRKKDGTLLGFAMFDDYGDFLTLKDIVYDPAEGKRSLGKFIFLTMIGYAKENGKRHVYPGYWAKNSKIGYKSDYQPMERLSNEGWVPFDPETATEGPHYRRMAEMAARGPIP